MIHTKLDLAHAASVVNIYLKGMLDIHLVYGAYTYNNLVEYAGSYHGGDL